MTSILDQKSYKMRKNTKGIIRLSESQFKNLVEDRVKGILSEISWYTSKEASEKSDNRVDMLEDAWYHFEESANNLIQTLNGLDVRGHTYDHSDPQALNTQGPKLGKELENLMVKIERYVNRKQQQKINLDYEASEKFNQAFNGRDFDQVRDDIAKIRDEYDDSGEYNWERYRQNRLTPSEIEFDNKY